MKVGKGRGGLETFPEEGIELGLEGRQLLWSSWLLEVQDHNWFLDTFSLTGDPHGAPWSLTGGGEQVSALTPPPFLCKGVVGAIRSCNCFSSAAGSCSSLGGVRGMVGESAPWCFGSASSERPGQGIPPILT